MIQSLLFSHWAAKPTGRTVTLQRWCWRGLCSSIWTNGHIITLACITAHHSWSSAFFQPLLIIRFAQEQNFSSIEGSQLRETYLHWRWWHWNRLPREIIEFPSMEILKTCLATFLFNLIYGTFFRSSPEVPSKPHGCSSVKISHWGHQ